MQVHQEAANAAALLNPDGWAADPEALLALSESVFEAEHFRGEQAALEEAREWWKSYHAKFLAAQDIEARGYFAACVIELERVGAALAKKVGES